MMMQLGYVTMLWSSYVSYSQHYQTFAFNEDAELNKGYKQGTPAEIDLEKLPHHVQEAYAGYDGVDWAGNYHGQTQGTKAGGSYGNNDGLLPSFDANGNPISYYKYDINNKIPGIDRDAERFVRGSDGSVYYTNEHYDIFFKVN